MQLDDTDIALLDAVQQNARLTLADLGQRLGISASTCQRRLTRLEGAGIIEGYTALLDEERLGFDGSVIVQITLSGQSEAALADFERAVAAIPELVECHLMAGEADYLLRLVVRDMRDFERIHKTHISRLPHVSRIQSNMALRRIVRKPPPVR
ncbi:MAG: Lrp/AsnC family transcriptional regulator [Alphaproteobacteria bacterium]|nr:Lrp/AsnC family transcriptional regulator [Alphaproteobacteria bacterium]